MVRKHFHRRASYWRHVAELRRNPFAFSVALVSVSVLLSVLLAANAATASDAPSFTGLNIDRDRGIALIYALQAADSEIRLNAAQELGRRRAVEAVEALLAATYDPDARVREEAVTALGAIGAWRALPRLRELQIAQGNEYIQFAAFEAERQLTARVAQALQLPRSAVQTIAVVAEQVVYAIANNTVYVLREETWERLGQLPDTPRAVVLSDTGLWAATRDRGLYRSVDGGKTWEHIQFGLDTPTRLIVTALTVDPHDARRMYSALAQVTPDGTTPTPLGIARSTDGGATWMLLPDTPLWGLTTRLVMVPTVPGYLFGETNGEPWRVMVESFAF